MIDYQAVCDQQKKNYDVIVAGGGTAGWTAALAAARNGKRVLVVERKGYLGGALSSGLLVLEAAKRIEAGMSAKEVFDEVSALVSKTSASFVVDTLDFLHAGGRCSALAKLGANMLSLKPQIVVKNDEENCGKMGVGKKYRGKLDKVLVEYVKETLANRDDLNLDTIFITHSGISEERIALVKTTVEECANCKNIYITTASCTISAHCGPNTLGVLFLTK